MYKLFTNRYEVTGSVIHPPGFDLVKRMYQKEISNIVNYFHSRVYAVKSNHLLCRLLTISSVSIEHDLYKYVEIAQSRTPFIGRQFKFTSDISVGQIHDGIFYGPGNSELIIQNDDYFNPYDVIKDWRNIRAVEVLMHNISDLGLMIPNGKTHSTDTGFVSIGINIPLLLVQYRGWLVEQKLRSVTAGMMLGIPHFINMYVLPNMLYSHIELCLFNRLCNLHYGAPMGDSIGKYPFMIIKYADRVDAVLKQVLKYISNKHTLYSVSLDNIPSIYNDNCSDSLIMPDIAKTRQVWWALLLSRLKVMKFLIDVGGQGGVNNNGVLHNEVRKDLRKLQKDHVAENILPYDLYYDFNEMINSVM